MLDLMDFHLVYVSAGARCGSTDSIHINMFSICLLFLLLSLFNTFQQMLFFFGMNWNYCILAKTKLLTAFSSYSKHSEPTIYVESIFTFLLENTNKNIRKLHEEKKPIDGRSNVIRVRFK